MGLISKAKQAIREKIETEKQQRREATAENKKLAQAEREARRKERFHQAEERGKRSAQHEFGNAPKHSSRKSGGRRSSGFVFQPAPDPIMGLMGGRKPKPKPATKVVARVQAGNKTVTVREKVDAEEQKKKPRYDFYDPFAF